MASCRSGSTDYVFITLEPWHKNCLPKQFVFQSIAKGLAFRGYTVTVMMLDQEGKSSPEGNINVKGTIGPDDMADAFDAKVKLVCCPKVKVGEYHIVDSGSHTTVAVKNTCGYGTSNTWKYGTSKECFSDGSIIIGLGEATGFAASRIVHQYPHKNLHYVHLTDTMDSPDTNEFDIIVGKYEVPPTSPAAMVIGIGQRSFDYWNTRLSRRFKIPTGMIIPGLINLDDYLSDDIYVPFFKKILIASSCRHQARKNLSDVGKIFSQMGSALYSTLGNPELNACLIRTNPSDQYAPTGYISGIDQHVRLNWSEYSDCILDRMYESSMFLSLMEGFDYDALMALSYDVPIIVNNTGDIATVLKTFVDAVMLVHGPIAPVSPTSQMQSNDADVWVRRVSEILINPKKAIGYAQHLRKMYDEKYSWNNTITSFTDAIDRIATASGSSSSASASSSAPVSSSASASRSAPVSSSASASRSAPASSSASASSSTTSASSSTTSVPYTPSVSTSSIVEASVTPRYADVDVTFPITGIVPTSIEPSHMSTPVTDSSSTVSGPEGKKEEDSSDECKICMDEPIDSVLIPCGHMCACMGCADGMSTCPICRIPIVQRVKTFKS